MNPFTALNNFSPFHFIYFFHLSYQPFTSLHFAIHIYNSHPFTSLAFTFYFLSSSLPPLFCNFPTLVLKIWVLPWEVPIAPSGSWFQSVMDLFTKEYFPTHISKKKGWFTVCCFQNDEFLSLHIFSANKIAILYSVDLLYTYGTFGF